MDAAVLEGILGGWRSGCKLLGDPTPEVVKRIAPAVPVVYAALTAVGQATAI